MGIKIRVRPGVPKDIAQELRRLARGFQLVSYTWHEIRVVVLPDEQVFPDPDEPGCLGCFGWGRRRSDPLRIMIAAGLAKRLRREYGYPRSVALRDVGHTLLHELAHYEQWRDKREMTERGVKVRAANLYRLIRYIEQQSGRRRVPRLDSSAA